MAKQAYGIFILKLKEDGNVPKETKETLKNLWSAGLISIIIREDVEYTLIVPKDMQIIIGGKK